MKRGIFLLLALAAVPAYAEDVKQMVMMMPNEEAECRYVADLRRQADTMRESFDTLRQEATDLEAQGATREAANKWLAVQQVGDKVTLPVLLQVTAAVAALKVKRGTLPECAVAYDAPAQEAVKSLIYSMLDATKRAQSLIGQLR